MAAFLILALTTPAFAAVGVKSAGSNLCTAADVNFSTNTTVTCDGSTATVVGSPSQTITGGTIDGATIGQTTPAAINSTAIIVKQYTTALNAIETYQKIQYQYFLLYAYTASNRPASGAPAGAIVSVKNANSQADCGITGGGAVYVVCSSDGTNWKSLRSSQAA